MYGVCQETLYIKVKLGTKQLCRVGQSSHSTSYALLSASSSWLVVNLFFFFFCLQCGNNNKGIKRGNLFGSPWNMIYA